MSKISTPYSFPKSEKLTGKKQIASLFQKSSPSLFAYPFKLVYTTENNEKELLPQVLISVSKRNFSKAVDRNRIKRQIREIYRLHKAEVFSTPESITPKHFSIIFVGKKHEPFELMQQKLVMLLKKMSKTSPITKEP